MKKKVEPFKGYRMLHYWVEKRLGRSMECSKCGFISDNTRQFHWANLSGKYKRDIKDWARMCAKCHKLMDYGNKCKKGHPYTPESTVINSNGTRQCRICKRISSKKWNMQHPERNWGQARD